jgi:dTDP-4-amino-4,6-dideoxygalactose transaminase
MINVTKPYLPDINKYERYIESIYKNSCLTNHGPLEKELTTRLSEYLGVKNLILVANGTLALSVAYKLLGLKKKALTTPFSYVATTSSLVWDNINPIFSDIDSKTFNLNPALIEKCIEL